MCICLLAVSLTICGQSAYLWSVCLLLVSLSTCGQSVYLWSVCLHQVSLSTCGQSFYLWSVYITTCDQSTVFQLGLFLRALRPARTGLRPARFARALPEFKETNNNLKKKKKNYFLFLQNVIVFSDSRCKNACRFVPMFSSIAHKTKFWSFTRKRFCVVCAQKSARILVVRALDCAQFLLHPALFPT